MGNSICKKEKDKYPSRIKFTEPPFGVVTIQVGQFGYEKMTKIRLKRDKKGIFFETKDGKIYREDMDDICAFILEK